MVSIRRVIRRGGIITVIMSDGARVQSYAGAGSQQYYPRANELDDGGGTVDPPDPPAGDWAWPFQHSEVTGGVGGANDFGSNYGGPSTARPSHTGRDYGVGRAVNGAPNRSCGPGTVSQAYISQMSPFGGGYEVQVQHVVNGTTYTVFYSHGLQGSIAVNVGDAVTVGQQLSQVGSTGQSTGPHLHFAVHRGLTANGALWVNPAEFMAIVNPGDVQL